MEKQGIENQASTAGKDELDMVDTKDGFEGYVVCVDNHPLRPNWDQTDFTAVSATNTTEKFQKKMPFWRRCCVKFGRCCCCCCPKCSCCCCCVDGTDD